MKTLRYAFWAIVALILILVGLANRGMVTLRAMPASFSDYLGISPDIQMPLFVAIFIGVGVGLLLGFVWEWIREYKERAVGRAKAREVEALRRELAALKTSQAPKGDDVLALLGR
ncbi:MAG: LapA family protein [Yoonia sp.]|nr:LapA family protein [Yoonia sp.]